MVHDIAPIGRAALLASVLGLSCSGPPATPGPSDAAAVGLPPGHPTVEAPRLERSADPGTRAMSGIVLETVDGGGYTYARLDFAGEERWVAGPESALSIGDTVAVADMANMGPFSSPSLGRSFEELYFTGSFGGPGAATVEHRGVVTQVVPAGSYLYLEVEAEGVSRWLAAPAAQVHEGDSVGWNGGSLMRDFASPSLGRTFSEILLVEAVTVLG